MREFDYQAPRSLAEVLDLLKAANGQGRALAGGTDLIPQMQLERHTPALVLDVKRIPELNRLEFVEGEGLHIGAAVPCAEVADSPAVRQHYPMIAQACELVGGAQIKNRASVGGNLCNAAPSADTAPALICLDAEAVVAGPVGMRRLALRDFFLGPGQTALGPAELLVELVVPVPASSSAGSYLRFTPREEMDIAVVGVGSYVSVDPKTRRCRRARITLGAVAPTPLRAVGVEALLEGRPFDEAAIAEAAQRASEEARPISDVRGSAEYRLELVKVLTRRTLNACRQTLGV